MKYTHRRDYGRGIYRLLSALASIVPSETRGYRQPAESPLQHRQSLLSPGAYASLTSSSFHIAGLSLRQSGQIANTYQQFVADQHAKRCDHT